MRPISFWRATTRRLQPVLRSFATAGVVAVSLLLVGVVPARADTAGGLQEFRNGQFSEAVGSWRAAAEQGDAAAALYLGVLYDTGFGVAQSPAQALAWYRRGGERGNVTAMFNAAVMLDAGRGTAADPVGAVDWYEKATRAGSGRADYNLGLIYENGIGVPVDRQQAIHFYRQAVSHGVSEGRAHLARLGVSYAGTVSAPKADPAMTNFQQAQRALLARGPDADATAASLFRKSADAGNALAAYNLGYCYEHGIGVPRNAQEAAVWYRRSAATASEPALREMATSGEQSLRMVQHVQR